LLQIFRSNQLYSGLLLIFYVLLLRLPAWWAAAGELNGLDPGAGIFGVWYDRVMSATRAGNILVPIFVLFVTAIAANRLAAKERMSRKVTQFPGLFILLVASMSPALLGAHSTQPASLMLLIGLFPAMRLYRTTQADFLRFNTGLWLGIAILFNVYYLIFLAFLVILGSILNTLSPRMILQFVVACLLPSFLIGVSYYWFGQYETFQALQYPSFGRLGFVPEASWNLGALVVYSGLLGFTLFKQNDNVKLLNFEGRKKVTIIYWWLFFCFPFLLFGAEVDVATLQVMAVPLGILLSLPFSQGSRQAGEAGHLLLALFALILNCLPFIV